MSVSAKHILSQWPVLRGLGEVALKAATNLTPKGPAQIPGEWMVAELPCRPPELVRDYIRHVGGDPAWYKGRLPGHFFPQWSFHLASKALLVLPYPLTRVMNAGCRIEQNAPLPADEPLVVRVRLSSVDDDGSRVKCVTQIETGTKSEPMALRCEMRTYIPLGKPSGEKRVPKPKSLIPSAAREIGFFRLGADAGLDFAKLTGDFNPIHWIAPAARAAGFRSCILHGFSTLGRAIEALNRSRFAGDPTRLQWIDVRFVRPLVLPAAVGVYVGEGGALWVGDAPSGGSYLEGQFLAENEQ